MTKVLLRTELDLPLVSRGKVRDIYAIDDKLLIVATDRLSAFDVVFNEGIPDKGKVLTQVSLVWAKALTACRPYHLSTADVRAMSPRISRHAETLAGRSMLVEKLTMFPVECVVRGYLVGSSFKDYQKTGAVCGHVLPKGMKQGDAFPEPLFTPATKAEHGAHDENISFARMVELVGKRDAEALRTRSLEIFVQGQAYAKSRGLILVDTKLELGRRADGTLVLGDEVLTPDSSRYWDAADAEKTPRGETPPSFDKQVVRDWLEASGWNKEPPPPALPAHIVEQTAERYRELARRLGAVV